MKINPLVLILPAVALVFLSKKESPKESESKPLDKPLPSVNDGDTPLQGNFLPDNVPLNKPQGINKPANKPGPFVVIGPGFLYDCKSIKIVDEEKVKAYFTKMINALAQDPKYADPFKVNFKNLVMNVLRTFKECEEKYTSGQMDKNQLVILYKLFDLTALYYIKHFFGEDKMQVDNYRKQVFDKQWPQIQQSMGISQLDIDNFNKQIELTKEFP